GGRGWGGGGRGRGVGRAAPRWSRVRLSRAGRQSSAQKSPAGPLPTTTTRGAPGAGRENVGGDTTIGAGGGSSGVQASTTSRQQRARRQASNDRRRSRTSARAPRSHPTPIATA